MSIFVRTRKRAIIPFSFSSSFLKLFCTSVFDPQSYLIKNCGFTQEIALKASHKLRLTSSENPDSVIAFFKSHGFSNSQICNIIRKGIFLLSCNLQKVLLPKFQFLHSKGASASDIIRMVTLSPLFLQRSLQNHIIPSYELTKGFLQSDNRTIACLIGSPTVLYDSAVSPNIKLLLDQGMTRSNIAMLFRTSPRIFCSTNLLKTVEELKQLGFDTSTSTFGIALLAKRTVSKTRWVEKVENFMSWGWSQEQTIKAFKKQPYCMLSSTHKINAVMSFWVHNLGLSSLDLVNSPGFFLLSLEKRIVPRAAVVMVLISKGLRKKDPTILRPFFIPEKLFLEKFVMCFKEDSSYLLKLYEEKMNLVKTKEKPSSSG